MKKLILASAALLIISFACTRQEPMAKANGIYDLSCRYVDAGGSTLSRCVNSEVVCYSKYSGISCFKR